MKKLKAKVLREYKPTKAEVAKIKRNPIYFVLDEILDTYNIGSMFRLADAVAAEKMYLCGNMETPPLSRIHKAAVGTEYWVPWKHDKSTLNIIKKLKKQGVLIIAIEQHKKSVSYHKLNIDNIKFPVAIILGHETKGIRQEVLDEVDLIVELPMLGINNSFNVWGSASIVAYKLLESLIDS